MSWSVKIKLGNVSPSVCVLLSELYWHNRGPPCVPLVHVSVRLALHGPGRQCHRSGCRSTAPLHSTSARSRRLWATSALFFTQFCAVSVAITAITVVTASRRHVESPPLNSRDVSALKTLKKHLWWITPSCLLFTSFSDGFVCSCLKAVDFKGVSLLCCLCAQESLFFFLLSKLNHY